MLSNKILFLFDLDGTLIDSAQDISNSANAILKDMGKRTLAVDQIRPLIGLPAAEIFRFAGLDDGQDLDVIVSRFRQHLGETGGSPDIVYPGVMEALDKLVGRDLVLNVVTNKPTYLAKLVLERSQILDYFSHVQGTDGIEPKPSTLGINICMENAARSPMDTVMIGDSYVDIQAAKAAGCTSVGVVYHEQMRNHLVDANPDFLIENLNAIL
jgi:phosphoglycolate phosphatase